MSRSEAEQVNELSAEIAAEVLEACRAGAPEAAAALGRALDAELELTVGEPEEFDLARWGQKAHVAGLVVFFQVGGTGALVALAEQSGLLPDWLPDPDPTGRSKLDTLAQELGAVLLPERFFPDGFSAGWVENLAAAVDRGQPAPSAVAVPLALAAQDGRQADCTLIWPLQRPTRVLASSTAAESTADGEQGQAAGGGGQSGKAQSLSLGALPEYARSLLRIKVPVVVTLARKRQPLGRILELGPGSIIQFDKGCEELLELDVAGRPVATGEAVKVGDKFGLRISSIVLPGERFRPVKPRSGSEGQAG
ncbi:MAG TPA: hypothetical protein EYP56_18695 [Planctomycetaceae bacterium]|nr:hypothetical protein [Planctomycetaceae bacterium]